jgi:hypothetical protein
VEHKIQADVKQQCEEEYKRRLVEMRNEMRDEHAKELETRIEAERRLMTDHFEKLTTMLKTMAEEEQVCLTLTECPCGWDIKSCILRSYFGLFQTALVLHHRMKTIFFSPVNFVTMSTVVVLVKYE